MPLFNSQNIFGFGITMATGDLELTVQKNTFPGLNGVESLTMGVHGLYTTVKGVLSGAVGTGAAGLQAAEATFRSYRDGNAYVLVDSFGGTWLNVQLESFSPQGRIKQAQNGIYFRPYDARFYHLSF